MIYQYLIPPVGQHVSLVYRLGPPAAIQQVTLLSRSLGRGKDREILDQ